jgi:4-amino-4-deoxy-L-arabinose transferase-like glycosyltransferase
MKVAERNGPLDTSVNSDSHLLWAMAAALAIRLIVVSLAYPEFLVRGRHHWEFAYEMGKIADSLAHGRGFSNPYWIPTGPTAMITPVFPYLMSFLFTVFGAYTKAAAVAVLTVNSLASALTCVPIFFLARNNFGVRPAIAAVWTWAVFPYAVYFSASSMWYHSLVALLLTSLLWFASFLESRNQLWMWAGFGLLWGITVLTTPVVLSVVPFLGGWICYRLHRNGKTWKTPLLTLSVAFLATLAPWMIRNYRVFHRPVFIKDNFWMELCVGNLDDAPHWWNESVHPSGNNAELVEFRQLGELGYMHREREQGLGFLESHPGVFLWRSLRRVIYMWTGFWSFRSDYLREEPFDLANIFFATPFTVLAIVGLYKALRSSWQTAMPYVLVLLAFPLAYYLTHSDISYRDPIDPEIVALAAFAVFSRPKPAQEPAPLIEVEDELEAVLG